MDEARAAPLRDGPTWERVLRVVLALLLAGWAAYGVAQWLRQPRLVQGGDIHGALLNDIAGGKVTVVDDSRDGFVLWRVSGGEVFAERDYPGTVDLRATVGAQPYVRDHPGAVRYGRIDAPAPRERGGVKDAADAAIALATVLLIVTGPAPRLATRWGWFWLGGTPVGQAAYLLFSGSRRRTVDDGSARLRGGKAFAVAVVLWVGLFLVPDLDAPRDGEQPDPGTAPVVQVNA